MTCSQAAGKGAYRKHLGQRYVQYVNLSYRRSGTLWDGRFRSCLAQSETYVLGCYRYIELNPVRANMVEHPRQYAWSSYSVNAEGNTSSLITPHSLYRRLGLDDEERMRSLLVAGLFAMLALLQEQFWVPLLDLIVSNYLGFSVSGWPSSLLATCNGSCCCRGCGASGRQGESESKGQRAKGAGLA